jgi:serine/threonine protein kinase
MFFIEVEYHQNNLFHGDIKPANIFFYEHPRLLDMTTDIGSLLYLGEPN